MPGLNGRPVVFGEVLFDCFEDGNAVLGGAPFNVAWHLAGFGLDPLFVSRIGSDEHGERVLSTMGEWGMDVAAVQRDSVHPTGSVQVALVDGQPEYRILPDQAYDYIGAEGAVAAMRTAAPALLYHGSLIARSRGSRQALDALRADRLATFVDINLRAPWWTPEGIDGLLRGARWIKLNEGELAQLAAGASAPAEDARRLCGRYGCDLLIVTQGQDGGFFVGAPGQGRIPAAAVPAFVDSVGAGDAFSAVTILGLLRGWRLVDTLERAARFAARICGIRGATTRERGLYDESLRAWESAG